MTTSLRDWSTRDDVAARLLCLPAAGSGPQIFRRWARRLPRHIGVLAVELPGHGARLREPPPTSVSAVVDGPLRDEVRALLDRPLVVFGHSMGALLAFELCRRAGAGTDWRPALFVAAACAEPEAEHVPSDVARMSDAEVLDFLRVSGGTAAELLANREYAELLAPVVRADLRLVAGHRFEAEPVLGCPVRAYVGSDDPAVTSTSAAGWARQGDDGAVVTFPGGHFFFQDSEDAVIRQLCRDIDGAIGRLPALSLSMSREDA